MLLCSSRGGLTCILQTPVPWMSVLFTHVFTSHRVVGAHFVLLMLSMWADEDLVQVVINITSAKAVDNPMNIRFVYKCRFSARRCSASCLQLVIHPSIMKWKWATPAFHRHHTPRLLIVCSCRASSWKGSACHVCARFQYLHHEHVYVLQEHATGNVMERQRHTL